MVSPSKQTQARFDQIITGLGLQAERAVGVAFQSVPASQFVERWAAVGPSVLGKVRGSTLVRARTATETYLKTAIAEVYGVFPSGPLFPVGYRIAAQESSWVGLATHSSAVVKSRMREGLSAQEAVDMEHRTWSSRARGEPDRAARQMVSDATVLRDEFAGYKRVAESGACAFCLMLATRGGVYQPETSGDPNYGGVLYHRKCRCQAVPEIV